MLVKEGLEQRFRAFFEFFDNFGSGARAAIQFAVGALQILDTLFGETFGMQAQGVQVQGAVADGVARRLGAWGNVAVDLMGAAHESVGADLIALLDGGNATDGRIFADAHVAAQLATVRNDDSCSNIAVMGDMRVGHYQDMVCDACATAALYRATVERTIFAYGAVFANFEPGGFARVF